MTEQKAQAKDLLAQMISMDLSKESMEIRLDEVEAEAKRLQDEPERKRSLLDLAGEIRRLISKDRKLAAAGLLAGRRLLPYSKL